MHIRIMAIASIDSFLKNPDVETGLHLYGKFIKNKAKLFFYEMESLPFEELVEELNQFNLTAKEPEKNIQSNKKNYPEEIRVLDEIASKAWKERTYLRAVILQETNQEVRKQMAFKILDNAELCFDYWNKIKHWENTGELPTKNIVSKDNLLTVIDKLKNIPTYLSKIKKKLEAKPDLTIEAELIEQRNKHTADLSAAQERLLFLNEKIEELCL